MDAFFNQLNPAKRTFDESEIHQRSETPRVQGLVGFSNPGNYCYINSVLQALSNCPPLVQYLTNCYVSREPRVAAASALSSLLRDVWNNSRYHQVISSRRVTQSLRHSTFSGMTQQDAQEFMRYLLNRIHEELKEEIPDYFSKTQDDCKSLRSELSAETTDGFDDVLHMDTRIITDEPISSDINVNSVFTNTPTPIKVEKLVRGRSNSGTMTILRQDCVPDKAKSSHSSKKHSLLSRASNKANNNNSNNNNNQNNNNNSNLYVISPSDVFIVDKISNTAKLLNPSSITTTTTTTTTATTTTTTTTTTTNNNNSNNNNNNNNNNNTNNTNKNKRINDNNDNNSINTQNKNNTPTISMTSSHKLSHKPTTDTQPVTTNSNVCIRRTSSNSTNNSSGTDSSRLLKDKSSSVHSLQFDADSVCRKRQHRPDTPTSIHKKDSFPEIIRPKQASIITDIFEGKLKSSVKCLTCKKVSITTETFQDLSLPIPNKKELSEAKCSENHQDSTEHCNAAPSYRNSVCNILYHYVKDLIVSPNTSLDNCLDVFFRKDELKGSNRYYCEHCCKLRNSMKYSRILQLPEILCIHFKRFRHDGYWSSSKISRYISFPLHSLDLSPFMVKGVRVPGTYELISVVCHIGGVGGGHYIAYAMNCLDRQWYMYDDETVRRTTLDQVRSLQSYMLLYRLQSHSPRHEVDTFSYSESHPQIDVYYISKHWLSLYENCYQPGPIAQYHFLCSHGDVKPQKSEYVSKLVRIVSSETWEILHDRYGGGPVVTELTSCQTCLEEFQMLKERRASEKRAVQTIQESEYRHTDIKRDYYLISMEWLKEWQIFINNQDTNGMTMVPGPVDNRCLISQIELNSPFKFRYSKLSKQISGRIWEFFINTYGGGPTLIIPATSRL